MKTAFVTGGSGFVGRNLVRHLGAHGWIVRGLARSEGAAAVVSEAGGEPVAGDLEGGPAVVEGMRGADAVFHLAAWADDWGDPAEAHRGNVVGTERMLAAAREAGVPRFVHTSTEAVLVDGTPIVQATEARPLPSRPVGLYPRTKGQAEAAVVAACGGGLETVVVRPRLVWGKGDTTLLPRFIEAARSGGFAWVGGGRYLTSTTHVENCCEGLRLAAERGRPGEVYFVTDGPPIEFREFLTRLLATQGVTVPDRSVPRWVAHLVAIVTDWVWRTFRLRGRPPLPHASFHLMAEEVTVVDEKARRELGYVGGYDRERGYAEMTVVAGAAPASGRLS